MPIVASDILIKYSVKAAQGNNTAGNADGSLGRYISTSVVPDATLHNLFDAISGDENAAGNVEYRCVFVHNNHATLTLYSAVVWIASEVAGGAVAAISVDTTPASAVGATVPQAKEIANEDSAPLDQPFTAPTTKSTGLALGDLGPGQVRAIWVRRTATNSAAVNNDGATIRVEGDTAA